MFSPGIKDIIHQEMLKERDKLEQHIKSLEDSLDKASRSEDKNTNDNNTTNNTLTASYSHWDTYEDIEELQEQINGAKKALFKLNDKIQNHNNPNSSSEKTCGHRYRCSCSGDKRAERAVVAMKTCDRLDEMVLFKEQGKTLFTQQNYKEALALYEKSLIYFEYCFDGSQDERKQADAIREVCLLNAAACFLRLKLYSKCIEYCTDAIQVDGSNPKAWFRRARALRLTHDFDSAEKDLERAREVSNLAIRFSSSASTTELAACLSLSLANVDSRLDNSTAWDDFMLDSCCSSSETSLDNAFLFAS